MQTRSRGDVVAFPETRQTICALRPRSPDWVAQERRREFDEAVSLAE